VVGLDVSGKEWDVWNGRGGWMSRRECGEIVPAGLIDGSIVAGSVVCRLCRLCNECIPCAYTSGDTKEGNVRSYD